MVIFQYEKKKLFHFFSSLLSRRLECLIQEMQCKLDQGFLNEIIDFFAATISKSDEVSAVSYKLLMVFVLGYITILYVMHSFFVLAYWLPCRP